MPNQLYCSNIARLRTSSHCLLWYLFPHGFSSNGSWKGLGSHLALLIAAEKPPLAWQCDRAGIHSWPQRIQHTTDVWETTWYLFWIWYLYMCNDCTNILILCLGVDWGRNKVRLLVRSRRHEKNGEKTTKHVINLQLNPLVLSSTRRIVAVRWPFLFIAYFVMRCAPIPFHVDPFIFPKWVIRTIVCIVLVCVSRVRCCPVQFAQCGLDVPKSVFRLLYQFPLQMNHNNHKNGIANPISMNC